MEDKARDKPEHRVRDKTSEMSMCISTAQARTNYAPRGSQGLALRHFHCNFSRQHSLLRCPCAFRPRRLAQSLRRAVLKLLVCGIFIGKCCMRRFSAPRGSEALGLRNFCWKNAAYAGSCGDPANVLPKRFNPVQVHSRRSCGDPGSL